MSLTNKKVVERWCEYISGNRDVSREGRNASGSIFYEGDVIYSYGYHFPIAKFEGGRMVLFNTDKYSRTTSVHQRIVRNMLEDYYFGITEVNTKAIKGQA